MTDDGTGNPRFAFIPKRAWDLLLDLAPIPLAGIAIWFSFRFVAYLAYYVDEGGEFGPLVPVFFGSEAPPIAIAIGTALYFLLDILLQRRERAGAIDHEGFGHSRLLLVSAAIVVFMVIVFWCLKAMHGWQDDSEFGRCCLPASVGLGGAWVLAAGTAAGLRRFGNRFEAISFLPPIACLIATLLTAAAFVPGCQVPAIAASLLPSGELFTTIPGLLVVLTICLTTSLLPAALWAERELFHSRQRAIGIACAALWAFAAAMAWWLIPSMLLLRRVIGLSSWLEPDISLEPFCTLGIVGVFLLAACARMLVFYRRRAAMASSAKPGDS